MYNFTITGISGALSANGLANDVAYSGGGYALTANTVSTDGLGHKITILGNAATNHSAKTFTVTGLDANSNTITDAIAGPNGNVTVTGAKYFASVTSVTVDSTTGADTFDIGWNASSASAWHYLSRNSRPGDAFNVGFACVVGTGTPTFGVEQTYDGGVTAFAHGTVVAKNASIEGTYTTPVQAIRLTWTAAGQVTLYGYQA